MSSMSAVVCREIFDENSQPSAEEISDYAQQLGIDPESESHLLPLARDGLMQALPSPWKAYFDEKLQTHYYYNEETKITQWEHPLDHVYRELVKRSRDASMHDDTCASVQELPTSEEATKNLERVETKVESEDDELSTDSDNQTDAKEPASSTLVPGIKRLIPLGRPPLAPLGRLDKKLSDIRVSPLRRSAESTLTNKPMLMRNTSDRDILSRSTLERPKMLFKQHSEIIDLKMHVLNSPEDEHFSSLLAAAKVDKGLPLTGKGGMFYRISKSDLPSPDTDKSLPLESMTKSDPPKSILREKFTDALQKKGESVTGRQRQASSFDEDKKIVRFKLENLPEPTISPGSNSSSEQNDGQGSIISAAPAPLPSPLIPSSPIVTSPVIASPALAINPGIVLSPLVSRPPLPPRPISDSPREVRSISGSERDSLESESRESKSTPPGRRLLRPPAADYIKPDLFQKNFQKISDLVRPGDIETTSIHLEEPAMDKEARPRSPMIPQKSKISINLMESIESETSIDSPDKEFANLDLNDLDDSNEEQKLEDQEKISDAKDYEKADVSDKTEQSNTNSKVSVTSQNKPALEKVIPQIKVPNLDLSKPTKFQHSDSDDSRNGQLKDDSKTMSNSIELPKTPQLRVSPTPSYCSDLRSPREFSKPWSPLSTFKSLNKAVIAPQMKTSESAASLGKTLTSPRLDGVIISQGKSSSDNVVVVYQFETQEDTVPKPIRSPLIPDMGTRDMIERNKGDERRRLELSLQKELESIRMEWAAKERRMRAELQEELREAEEKFLTEKRLRLTEQTERQSRELEEALSMGGRNQQQKLEQITKELEDRYRLESEAAERQHLENMEKQRENHRTKLAEQRELLEIENERAISDLREQLQSTFNRERAHMIEENRTTMESLREEHTARVTELRHDYRAEVERLRSQHACHLEELRARLAGERGRSSAQERELADKYRCLKQKYARLKHDVKMSIERRNKRREMSMTTGSETEKSNSHKATQSLERCKEANETLVSAVIETEPVRTRMNNNPAIKYNDNETSHSESHAHKSYNLDNNNEDWKLRRENTLPSTDVSQTSAVKMPRPPRRAAVAFREPPRRRKDKDTGAATECQDSSDATTADERPKENFSSPGRRRCFTRLKSASTSRLNYSPKRGEGWSSPLESLRQQLRKLDDLEDQFPDLACQPAYSLRYPFGEIGPVSAADSPELEFVRHRALVEREGMRRARAALQRRRAALRENRAQREPRRGHEEATTSDASSGSEAGAGDAGGAGRRRPRAGGAVLRSLRALHADVRDIWRALDARKPQPASPETSSSNAHTASQTRMILSAPEAIAQDSHHSDGGVAERARGLRAWLQTAP
ncbi:LOW QUALITY PROTEIN: centrosomal protein 164 [Aphomia sociella]